LVRYITSLSTPIDWRRFAKRTESSNREGVIFAAAVSRFASLIDGLSKGYFSDAVFRDIIAADLATGQHRNPIDNPAYFTTAYFHHPEEITQEVNEAGFKPARVLAIEGPAWSAAHFRDAWANPGERDKLMQFLSLIEAEPSIGEPAPTSSQWLIVNVSDAANRLSSFGAA
jgi:hypothetical protein